MDHTENDQSTTDTEKRSLLGRVAAIMGIILSVLCLLNLTAGVVEIPDNLPIVGNIDEAFATAVIIACLRYFGIDILPFLPANKKSQGHADRSPK